MQILDKGASLCLNGGMGACQCLCGGATKSDTARFIVGHDAKHKSALIKRALGGDESATAELTERNWLQFLEKARNSKGRKREENREKAKSDGLPLDAMRITPDMDEDTIAGIIRHRRIRIRQTIERYGITKEEDVEVASIRLVAEGEIDFYVCEGWAKDNGTPVPIPGALRTVRVEDVVGVYAE